jgi:hypothetical protein
MENRLRKKKPKRTHPFLLNTFYLLQGLKITTVRIYVITVSIKKLRKNSIVYSLVVTALA